MEVRDKRMVLKGLLPVVSLVAAWSLGVWWSPLPAGAQAQAPARPRGRGGAGAGGVG